MNNGNCQSCEMRPAGRLAREVGLALESWPALGAWLARDLATASLPFKSRIDHPDQSADFLISGHEYIGKICVGKYCAPFFK
jgi:hypothetical protein